MKLKIEITLVEEAEQETIIKDDNLFSEESKQSNLEGTINNNASSASKAELTDYSLHAEFFAQCEDGEDFIVFPYSMKPK